MATTNITELAFKLSANATHWFSPPVGYIENGRLDNFLTFTARLTQKIVCVNDTFFIDTDGFFNVHLIFCYGNRFTLFG
jgi:hypothetical protein